MKYFAPDLFILQHKSLIWKSAVKSGACSFKDKWKSDDYLFLLWAAFTASLAPACMGAAALSYSYRKEKRGEDPEQSCDQTSRKKTTSGTQSGPLPLPFFQTSPIMSKLSCGCKYSPLCGVWSGKQKILLFTLLTSFKNLIARGQLPWNYFLPPPPTEPLWGGKKRKKETHPTIIFIDEFFLCKLGLSRDPHQLLSIICCAFSSELVKCWGE